MAINFVKCCDPILDSPSKPLTFEEITSREIQKLLDEMLSFAKGEQGDQQKSVLVGLAAPQIGKKMRVILVDVQADGKGNVSELRLYINPEITEFSQESEEWYEACYSTGLVNGIVKRSSQITIKALDRNGKEIQETHRGYVARIFQHEIDHLDGKRFPDRIPDSQKLHLVQPEEMFSYRNQEGWRNWPKTITHKSWKEYMVDSSRPQESV